MRLNDVLLIIMVVLPPLILLWRRCFFTHLLSLLVVWAIWVVESWEPEADNNLGAATIVAGWTPVALYCGFCCAVIGLLGWVRRRVAGVGGNSEMGREGGRNECQGGTGRTGVVHDGRGRDVGGH